MNRISSKLLGVLLVVLVAAIAVPVSAKDGDKVNERFNTIVVGMGTVASGLSTRADIRISRWSTEEDQNTLLAALESGEEEALWKALQKQKPTGNFAVQGERGYRLRYAEEFPSSDGGRRIILATDRPIEIEEVASFAHSSRFRITFIEMKLDSSGQGEGAMLLGAKVTFKGGDLVIENYDTQPFRMIDIRQRK